MKKKDKLVKEFEKAFGTYKQWMRRKADTHENTITQADLYWALWEHAKQIAQAERERIIEMVQVNQKGTFIDEAGHDCWYVDDLVKALKNEP